MKIQLAIATVSITSAAFFTGTTIGLNVEANRIQETCEAFEGNTVINGQHYLCLTEKQTEAILNIIATQANHQGLRT